MWPNAVCFCELFNCHCFPDLWGAFFLEKEKKVHTVQDRDGCQRPSDYRMDGSDYHWIWRMTMKYCDRFKEENESVMERFQLSMERLHAIE